MSDIKFIEGGIFTDYRGQISHVNDLDIRMILFIIIICCFYIIHQKTARVFG